MRRVMRQPLAAGVQADLDARQTSVDQRRMGEDFSATTVWKAARQTVNLRAVLGTLQAMMGDSQRCMYCLDSHGTDIEHFWPKTPYPERMFQWPNLLLCCTECGRFKDDLFPVADSSPLLVDPTAEDPWQYLDFDPVTGNIVSKYDVQHRAFFRKGEETVGILHLDRREALANGYRRTYHRICRIVEDALGDEMLSIDGLMEKLLEADDHGLLAWCFQWSGQEDAPFSDLRDRHPDVWAVCATAPW